MAREGCALRSDRACRGRVRRPPQARHARARGRVRRGVHLGRRSHGMGNERWRVRGALSDLIALAEAEADGRLKPGMRVLAGAFGAGFTWGGALMEWGMSDGA